MNGFAELIAGRRDELGLSADEVSEAIGRSTIVLEAWERGRTFPEDPAIVAPLAKVLRLPRPLLREAYDQSTPHPRYSVDELGDDLDEEIDESGPPPVAVEPATDDTEVVEDDEAPAVEELPPEPEVEDEPPTVQTPPPLPPPADIRPAYTPPTATRETTMVVAPPEPAKAPAPDLSSQLSALVARPINYVLERLKVRRWASRAPTAQLSYVEDRKQQTTYQLRAIFTGAAVIIMVLLIRWAWSQFADAFGTLWQTLVDAI